MTTRGEPLEEGLLRALKALDNQVAREWQQRGAGEREIQGVSRTEAIDKRVESLTSYLIELFGDEEVGLESLMILGQSACKALSLLADELGPEGLGQVRSSHLIRAAGFIDRDIRRIDEELGERQA